MNSLKTRLDAFRQIDIYPVISSEFTNGRKPLDALKAVADGGAKIVQLREKAIPKKDVYELALQYRKITDEYNMLLIINDHVDIALSMGADGVHLGLDDLPLDAAKKIAPNLIIGGSTHSAAEIEELPTGADYINIGPIYSTQTKKIVESTTGIGLDLLKEVAPSLPIPFSVMGGIKEHHLEELIRIGARRIAMVTEITMADNITEGSKNFAHTLRNTA